MLLVVCPNLAVDRILLVDHFQSTKVQRSRAVWVQPGGKGSNVARVFRQLGGKVALVGFLGHRNSRWIVETLRKSGIQADAVIGYTGESRTCSIICDPQSAAHPTVVNEESPPIEPAAIDKLLAKVDAWIPRVDGVLTTGSLSKGLSPHFYGEILNRARCRGKITALDASGIPLRAGLLARPTFVKPNADEFREFTSGSDLSPIADHTAVTFGRAGATLIHDGRWVHALPPCVYNSNPIGAGDAFTAGYLAKLLNAAAPQECFRWAIAAATSDCATILPGFISRLDVQRLVTQVELRFQ